MSRRAFAVLAATGLVVVLLAAVWPWGEGAAGAPETTHVRLILHWKPQAQFAGYYAAVEKGFYREHGIDVEVLPGGPDIDSLVWLRSGRADFATAFLSGAVKVADGGSPMVNICQVVNRSGLLLVARRGTIADHEDLDNARVSLWGSSFEAAYLGFFDAAGIKPILVPQYYTVNLFLRGGVVACAAMDYNEFHTIIQSGVDPDELKVIRLRDVGFNFPEDGVYTLAETRRTRAALCREFAAATLEGWAWCRAHPEEALDIVMRRTREAHVPTNRTHQRWMLEHVLRAIYPEAGDSWTVGELSRIDYERTRAIMIGEGQIDGAPAYDEFVAPEARSAP